MKLKAVATEKDKRRFIAAYGGKLRGLNEFWTNQAAHAGLLRREASGEYLEFGTFKLKTILKTRGRLIIEVLPGLYVREALLKMAMRALGKRKFMKVGILKRRKHSHTLVILKKGGTIIAVAPLFDVTTKETVTLQSLSEVVPSGYETIWILKKLEGGYED